MTGYEIASTVIAVIGLLGGVFGFVWAQISNRKATAAVEEAHTSAKRSAAAQEAAVDALRRANDLTEAMMPKPMAAWRARTVGFWMVELHNVGDAAAISVVVGPVDEARVKASIAMGFSADDDVHRANVLHPTEMMSFSGMRFGTGSVLQVRFRVEWGEEGHPERKNQIVETEIVSTQQPRYVQFESSIAPPPAPRTY